MNCISACPDGVAQIRGGEKAPELSGRVRFYQEENRVLVVAEVSGLPKSSGSGFFALHIHAGSSCEGVSFGETGGHFNPEGVDHPGHAGDLPPLLFCGGEALLTVYTNRFRVRDVIGKIVVIHGGADDFRSQPAGNAGRKIGCGVIRGRRRRD